MAATSTHLTYLTCGYQLRNGVWVKLEAANANGISGINTNEITVPASAVVNVGIFKCVIKDTDTASATANKEVFAIGTLYDGSDPYEIDVFQPTAITLLKVAACCTGLKYVKGLPILQIL